MMRARTSPFLFGLLVAAWVLIPARYSRADRVKTEVETYSSGSDMDSAPLMNEHKREYRESQQSSLPGSEEKTSRVETYRRSDDMDSPYAKSEHQYKSEHSESHLSSFPGDEVKKSEVETYRRSDTDLAPSAESEYRYNSERRDLDRFPAPTVREYDRTIIERDNPAPPRESRLQAWWHRNIHGDTD